jgi:hypothetical protein
LLWQFLELPAEEEKIQVPEGEPNTPWIPTCRMGTWGAYLYKIFEHEEHVSVTL